MSSLFLMTSKDYRFLLWWQNQNMHCHTIRFPNQHSKIVLDEQLVQDFYMVNNIIL